MNSISRSLGKINNYIITEGLLAMVIKCNLLFHSKTPQDALSYDTPDNETAVELLRFQHNFIVQKFGASPVHQAALSIIFPYAMHRDKNEIKKFLVVSTISLKF